MNETKRKNILFTAMQLFNQNGFHGTPTSLIAKKATKFLIGKGQDILVDAVSTTEENKMIEFSDFSLFLISS